MNKHDSRRSRSIRNDRNSRDISSKTIGSKQPIDQTGLNNNIFEEDMPTLRAGESLLIGDAVVLPSVVKIDMCDPTPASTDIPYWQ